jgi:hypothetical protein
MKFNPGFRISKLDIGVVVAALSAAVWLYGYSTKLALLVLFVAGHFFLFCNVIRMSRIPELIWGGVFTGACISSLQFGTPPLAMALSLSVVATAVLVFLELRKPSYHGVFWRKVNPHLPEWFGKKNDN